jgi:hypothetical protein
MLNQLCKLNFNFNFRQSIKECNSSREGLSVFQKFFQTVTDDLFKSLMDQNMKMTFEAALSIYDPTSGQEKDFLSLILLQGKNNVNEVKCNRHFKYKVLSTCFTI